MARFAKDHISLNLHATRTLVVRRSFVLLSSAEDKNCVDNVWKRFKCYDKSDQLLNSMKIDIGPVHDG